MKKIAQVIVNIPTRNIDKAFSYIIPDHYAYIDIGWRVIVPFGQRTVEGFIINISDISERDETALKPITDILDDFAWFGNHMLKTAEWLAEYYLTSLAESYRMFIPGKAGVKTQELYKIADSVSEVQLAELKEASKDNDNKDNFKIIEHIYKKGPLKLSELRKEFRHTISDSSLEDIIKSLLRQKILCKHSKIYKSGLPRLTTVYSLAVDAATAINTINATSKRKPAQLRLIEELLKYNSLDSSQLRQLSITLDTVKRLVKLGLIHTKQVQIIRDSYADREFSAPKLKPTQDQEQVLGQIIPAILEKKFKSFLLRGVTGSGKTQVYIEAVRTARNLGRQAIVLVPEIALTSQIVSRFKAAFNNDVVVIHSRLSLGERYDAWQRLRCNQAGIVIGARSAIFTPADNLGLIVIDEEHEFTYKQEEAPRYHAKEVALTRAKFSEAVVILGSATPSVETYFQALQGEHSLVCLTRRIDSVPLPPVTVVDMRNELAQGRRGVISPAMQDMLSETFSKGEQAVILLNRRGYSTFIMCRECGHVIKCHHCDIAMVYHAANTSLRCHYCQERQAIPDCCPVCGSRYIRYFGTGTQKVEETLTQLFPQAKIARMDQDTTSGKTSHEKILSDFAKGSYDILLGTQMVAKGHDIKNVTAVGIISADTALNLPDFRAAERTFSLITQAAGRAGRGNRPGKVVLQTYNPEHFGILSASTHDYETFFRSEIKLREQLDYPPFTQLINICVLSKDNTEADSQAKAIVAELKCTLRGLNHTSIIGPFPAPISKKKDVYRINILLKTRQLSEVRNRLSELKLHTRKGIIIDVDPLNVL
ncbi:MAG TPA: primosomal protein N' [Methylomusa anaerophila]|uniref:Replication restart protein PriA n=1 Tax=Methylomusa anaerophila TaxID=1930071 RepID=A0A348APM9_9FIRM|nr:primosomal protein N' [Methylomusa anaerophila]BBB93027.1 primosomal protein N' [Methylomusa anaerophila]HML87139.1 primosomal protein N' [Methylomusa anaerophila]